MSTDDTLQTSPQETLEAESRNRNRQVAVAVAAGVLLMVAAILQLVGPRPKVGELTVVLLVASRRFGIDVIAAIVNSIAAAATAWTLVYVWGAARARNPERAAPYIRIIAILSAVLTSVGDILYQILYGNRAHEFATTGLQTYAEANRLGSGGLLDVADLLGLAGALLLALSFVLVALAAMNTGLLTRLMGYLGMFAGALVLFQIFQVPIVQTYWLLALAYLLSGRWPTGVPPAWKTGRAEPWPSSAEMRTRRAAETAARGGGRGGGRGVPVPAPAPEPQAAGGPAESRTRSTTPKRKRKRRS